VRTRPSALSYLHLPLRPHFYTDTLLRAFSAPGKQDVYYTCCQSPWLRTPETLAVSRRLLIAGERGGIHEQREG
jgi:hypothetical protein